MPDIGLYQVSLRVGHGDMPGAPLLTLNLLVNAPTGAVSGNAMITQALPPPNGMTHIPHVTGQILHTGLGQDTRLVHLVGQYVVSVPPPAIGSYLAHFSAALAVDAAWVGRGSYEYNGHVVSDCTVENIEGGGS